MPSSFHQLPRRLNYWLLTYRDLLHTIIWNIILLGILHSYVTVLVGRCLNILKYLITMLLMIACIGCILSSCFSLRKYDFQFGDLCVAIGPQCEYQYLHPFMISFQINVMSTTHLCPYLLFNVYFWGIRLPIPL